MPSYIERTSFHWAAIANRLAFKSPPNSASSLMLECTGHYLSKVSRLETLKRFLFEEFSYNKTENSDKNEEKKSESCKSGEDHLSIALDG